MRLRVDRKRATWSFDKARSGKLLIILAIDREVGLCLLIMAQGDIRPNRRASTAAA
jgi:hypothetical protein